VDTIPEQDQRHKVGFANYLPNISVKRNISERQTWFSSFL